MLSYFGTDQSQVQRYLTARSVDEARSSLLMSAYWKIPLQALVLLIGVLVFVFYLFQRSRHCCSTRRTIARVRERGTSGLRERSSRGTPVEVQARDAAARQLSASRQ